MQRVLLLALRPPRLCICSKALYPGTLLLQALSSLDSRHIGGALEGVHHVARITPGSDQFAVVKAALDLVKHAIHQPQRAPG